MSFWPRLAEYCRSFEGAVEEYPWNDVVYKLKGKVFVFTSGDRSPIIVSAKPEPEVREALLQQPGVSVAAYVGRFGWLTVAVTDEATLELAQDMIAQSYGLIARKKKRA